MRQATSGPLNRQIVHTECAPPRQRNARARHADLEIILIGSGGDNLSATFSPELADLTIYVIDVAAGEDIPRKGGPALTRSDILVINKTDLAPHVGASLDVMQRDALAMRGGRPFFMTSLRKGMGVGDVVDEILHQSGLDAASLAKEGGS